MRYEVLPLAPVELFVRSDLKTNLPMGMSEMEVDLVRDRFLNIAIVACT